MTAQKRSLIKKVITAAELYATNLLNRNILLLGQRGDEITTLELKFQAQNFKHLTGVQTQNNVYANQFWRMCINHNLSERDIMPDYRGIAGMKLKVAPLAFRSDLSARHFGFANKVREKVDAEIFAGDTLTCLGFSEDRAGYFYPKSLLMSSIKDEVLPRDMFRVIGVYSKPIKETFYERAERTDQKADWDYVRSSLPLGLQYVTTFHP